MTVLFHEGNRQLQDRFDSRRIADRLEEKLTRQAFTDGDRGFIETLPFFFLATSDDKGRADCSFKGGLPGFVRVTGASELAFPDYDGNGMFKSLGNIAVNPHVGLLFIQMGEAPRRLRVNGEARISQDDPLMAEFPGAQLLVRHDYAGAASELQAFLQARPGHVKEVPARDLLGQALMLSGRLAEAAEDAAARKGHGLAER